MIKFKDQTPFMIGIWVTMTFVMLSIIITAIVVNVVWNKKYKNGVFTTKKITLFATFLSILIVQTLIDVYMPNFPGMPSFESMTTIAIGFMFGPLEGIIFGWTSDSFIVLLNGWTYQLLPGLMMPMTGLIAGLTGYVYRNRNDIKKWVSISVFQGILLLMMILMVVTSLTIVDFANGYTGGWQHLDIEKMAIMTPISCSITILILEGIFVYMLVNNISPKELLLISLILVTASMERTVELIVRPFSQVYYYSHMDYFIEFYMRVLRSSYLIPSITITSYLLIRTTFYVLDLDETHAQHEISLEGEIQSKETKNNEEKKIEFKYLWN